VTATPTSDGEDADVTRQGAAVQRPSAFRIEIRTWRPDPRLVERARRFPTALLSDAMQKMNTMDYRVKPVWRAPTGLCGPALTVRVRPGDNAMCVKAIAMAKPGDVIVVQDHWDTGHSIWGGIMSAQAQQRGIAGVVTDGLVRDVAQLEALAFPVWARGATPLAPNRNVPPGQIGTQIVCGNTAVRTGDLVRADDDGVVIIPAEDIEIVLDEAHVRQGDEEAWLQRIERGEQVLIDAVDRLLDAAGCVTVDLRDER
jgi:regulator of RNase E activity RraA